MFTRTLISLFFLFPLFSVAQVGVGTTSVHASAKLQIESSNKGFLQPRVALTGTADNSTIANPATGLMVFNTANAGSGSTAVTQGVYYYTGTAWSRLSDAPTTTFVAGTWGGGYSGLIFLTMPAPPPTISLGQIQLPPGRWEVVLSVEVYSGLRAAQVFPDPNTLMHLTYWLSTSSSAGAVDRWQLPQSLPNVTTDVITGGAASFTEQISITSKITHKGSFLINNTGATNKTYYLFGVESSTAYGEPVDDGFSIEFNSLGGTSWPQNRFYAVKIN